MPFTTEIPIEKRAEARKIFESTEFSCDEIASQIQVKSGRTVQTWARRGGWIRPGISPAKGLQNIAKVKLEQRIQNKIESRANHIAESATRIQAKMVEEGEKALDLISKARENIESSESIEADAVLKYAGALKAGVEVNRKLHGLDQDRQTIKIGLFLPVDRVSPTPLDQLSHTTIDVESVSPTDSLPTPPESTVD